MSNIDDSGVIMADEDEAKVININARVVCITVRDFILPLV